MAFQLHHILPHDSDPGSSTSALSASSIAIYGPLPASSLLHIALNHIWDSSSIDQRSDDEEVGAVNGREERQTAANVLILSPNRDALREALVKEGDLSLLKEKMSSRMLKALDRVQFKYLPTSTQLLYFFATVYTRTNSVKAYAAFKDLGFKSKEDASFLSDQPTLVILHDASTYLNEEVYASSGAEGYGSILAHFVSAFAPLQSLSSDQPKLMLIESAFAARDVPVIPPHRVNVRSRRTADEPTNEESDRITLLQIAERFFDAVGVVKCIPQDETAVYDPEHRRLALTMTSGIHEGTQSTTTIEFYTHYRELASGEKGIEMGKSW